MAEWLPTVEAYVHAYAHRVLDTHAQQAGVVCA